MRKRQTFVGIERGALIDDIGRCESCIGYGEPTYPGKGLYGVYPTAVETQFMAYYNEKGGLCFAAHDPQDHVKGISFYPFGEDGVMQEFMHFCGAEFGQTYRMAYPMVMRFFRGDWYDVAEIYRTWFEEQNRTEFVPITKNENLPAWYGESPIIITYPVRGLHDMDEMTPNKLYPYMNAMPHIERLEKELNSKIMSFSCIGRAQLRGHRRMCGRLSVGKPNSKSSSTRFMRAVTWSVFIAVVSAGPNKAILSRNITKKLSLMKRVLPVICAPLPNRTFRTVIYAANSVRGTICVRRRSLRPKS